MIQVVSHMTVAPGKTKEARQFVETHRKLLGVDVQWMQAVTPGAGEAGFWNVVSFDSLVAWAEFQQKMFDDPDREKRLKAWRDCLVPSAFTRTVYRTI
jgi:hypothetical protein